jgi:hypothetical protein
MTKLTSAPLLIRYRPIFNGEEGSQNFSIFMSRQRLHKAAYRKVVFGGCIKQPVRAIIFNVANNQAFKRRNGSAYGV